jgi:hypothetical protein
VWDGTVGLARIRESNARNFELLIEAAMQDPSLDIPTLIEQRNLWVAVDTQGRNRLADTPFLQLNIQFGNVPYWRLLAHQPPSKVPVPPGCRSLWPHVRQYLMAETLICAWHTAQDNPIAAQIFYGMAREVVAIIAAMPIQRILEIATHHDRALELRWADQLGIWKGFLDHHASSQEQKLALAKTQATTRLISELLEADWPWKKK